MFEWVFLEITVNKEGKKTFYNALNGNLRLFRKLMEHLICYCFLLVLVAHNSENRNETLRNKLKIYCPKHLQFG